MLRNLTPFSTYSATVVLVTMVPGTRAAATICSMARSTIAFANIPEVYRAMLAFDPDTVKTQRTEDLHEI